MHRINPDLDIISYIIEEVRRAKPDDVFTKSIQIQYMERGSLSKKQLEGLQGKALKIPGIHPGRMATLEAIIKKKLTKERAAATVAVVNKTPETDEAAGQMIDSILEKYPGHKRVLLFRANYLKNKILPPADKLELEKFYKLLMGKK
jgi:hypothetical protein